MATTSLDSITQIDGRYNHLGRAAAYLIVDGDEAAFIDNVTRFSVPYLLAALKHSGLRAEQVRHIIVTHIHLDHSGGTAELVKHCPNATVYAHPKAARHIIDPSRLVASARPVYGAEEFNRLFGEIESVDADRVKTVEETDTLELGSRTFSFLHTHGHANHHISIFDSLTNSAFTGDAFGLSYPQLQGGSRPYVSYVCAPPQFDPVEARRSVRRIRDAGVDRVYVTHFGMVDFVQSGAEQLFTSLDRYEAVVDSAAATDLEGDALLKFCQDGALGVIELELGESGLDTEDERIMKWALSEHLITSQGIAFLAERRRKG